MEMKGWGGGESERGAKQLVGYGLRSVGGGGGGGGGTRQRVR